MRAYLYDLLEQRPFDTLTGKLVNGSVMLLIFANVAAVMAESMADLRLAYAAELEAFDHFSVFVFSVEYLVRLWSCVEDPRGRYRHWLLGRVRFAHTPMALIDLLAVLPFYLAAVVAVDLRFLRVFRLLRVLRLTRYAHATELLGSAVRQERKVLVSALGIMLVLLVFASSLIYFAERGAQPKAFSSIPASMWWGMATLTTVGYGDMAPVTPIGRFLGSIIAILGIGMFALPAAVLANGFSEAMKRRDFLTSWRMVASVPLFSRLDAQQIADIVDALHARKALRNELLFSEGDAGDSAYFIVEGAVAVEAKGKRILLGPGDFFGEIAVVRGGKRTASVQAIEPTELMVLDAGAFSQVLASNPAIREAVERTASTRYKQITSEMRAVRPEGVDP